MSEVTREKDERDPYERAVAYAMENGGKIRLAMEMLHSFGINKLGDYRKIKKLLEAVKEKP
jgi:hypothetical protein